MTITNDLFKFKHIFICVWVRISKKFALFLLQGIAVLKLFIHLQCRNDSVTDGF